MSETSIIESQEIKSKIYTIRGVRVMLDRDLAELYQVKTEALNQAVKRNIDRFPSDFMFKLEQNEFNSLGSQNVISKPGRGGVRYMPSVFTEQGVAMLSGILRGKVAVEINIRIMRAFVELRNQILSNQDNSVLVQTVRFIESRMDTMQANHLVDHALVSGKVSQMSKENLVIREEMALFSKILDEFQNAHIIIKRPDEDKFEG